MTKGEKRFNELKEQFEKDFERTTGKKLGKIYYKDGFVHIESSFNHHHRISDFEEMCVRISMRKDFITKNNSGKVAKLVTVTFTTRVVVDENESEENIFEKARPRLKIKAEEEMWENLESIVDDNECPAGTLDEDGV